MKVLGIDTATWTATVGLGENGRVLAERTVSADRSHVDHLPGMVTAVLEDAGCTLDDLDGIAVTAGPGSFTGLRISAAFAKGLGFAGGAAVIAVPTLEAHAAALDVPPGTRVCVANDARRGEVYAATYLVTDDGLEPLEDARAWNPAELRGTLARGTVLGGDGASLVTGDDGAFGQVAFAPRGGVVALLGARRLAAGDVADLGTFEPRYGRAPDATLPATRLR